MAYTGTLVTYGRGVGVVVNTGMTSEIGQIAKMLQSVEEEDTPLQKRLDSFGQTLGWVTLVVSGIVFIEGMITGTPPLEMFIIAVSLAIAAVPEGLPAVVTITTQNEMTVTSVAVDGEFLDITGTGYKLDGEFLREGNKVDLAKDYPGILTALWIGALNNDAILEKDFDDAGKDITRMVGDPTEGALLVAAAKAGALTLPVWWGIQPRGLY